ncbi:hypothetical protein Dimus_011107 [Dionaea muscipula]
MSHICLMIILISRTMKLLCSTFFLVIFLADNIKAQVMMKDLPISQDLYVSQLTTRIKGDYHRYLVKSMKPRHSKQSNYKEHRRIVMEEFTARHKLLAEKNASSAVSVKFPMYMGSDLGIFDYLVDIELGTPPQKVKLIVDTGSDLTWMNCTFMKNLTVNNDENEVVKPFNAEQSSSFKTITCESKMCSEQLSTLFSLTDCPAPVDPCTYQYSYYNDVLSIMGKFGKEKIYLPMTNGTQATLLNVVGCTDTLLGTAVKGGDGVLGMGFNMQSFGYRAALKLGRGKFSYCLVDSLSSQNVTNYLIFGERSKEDTMIVGKMRHTELILGIVADLYALFFKGISLGETMLDIPSEVWEVDEEAGTIIDTGSSLTFLYRPIYDAVTTALVKALSSHLEQVTSDSQSLEYCFNSTGFHESMVPRLVFHFDDGARFKPHVKGYVIDYKNDVKCIGFLPTEDRQSMIGNILQQNYLWEYDLFRGRLGFAPSTCI